MKGNGVPAILGALRTRIVEAMASSVSVLSSQPLSIKKYLEVLVPRFVVQAGQPILQLAMYTRRFYVLKAGLRPESLASWGDGVQKSIFLTSPVPQAVASLPQQFIVLLGTKYNLYAAFQS